MSKLMGVYCVFGVLLLMSLSLANPQVDVLLDEPEFDVWDVEEQNPRLEAEKILQILCENYRNSMDQNFDCSKTPFEAREDLPFDDSYHVISKREAQNADLVEGSGTGEGDNEEDISLYKEGPLDSGSADIAIQNVAENNSTNVDEIKESDPDGTPKIDPELAAAFVDVQPIPDNEGDKNQLTALNATENAENGSPQTDPAVDIANADRQPSSSKTEDKESPVADEKQRNDNETSDQTQNKEAVDANIGENGTPGAGLDLSNVTAENVDSLPIAANAEVQLENTENQASVVTENGQKSVTEADSSRPGSEHEIPRSETTIAPPIQDHTESANVNVKLQQNQDADNDEVISRSATQKPLPSDLPEVETTQRPKEAEAIDNQQSGNAVLLKEPKVLVPVAVEGSDSDNHLAKLATNAKTNNQAADSEQPNTGESAKNVSKAGKDTTILIVLFVVVIVIGAAAFTHNFIKKRKQKNAENSEVVNGIRRSLQNLTSPNAKNSTDVEQGTEMKPLMKTTSPTIVKEYSDSKKEAVA